MASIDGATRIYAIIGDPIVQVRSPALLNPLIARSGRNAVLVPWHLKPAAFAAGLQGLMATENVDGIIFTYPHKQRALAMADIVLPRARQVQAGNTMRRNQDGRWELDMFDGVGLVRALETAGASVAGKRVWLVGAGGAGSAIAFALADAGATLVHITDIDQPKAAGLCSAISRQHPASSLRHDGPALSDVDIIVNASPVGLGSPDELPIPATSLLASLTVVDIVHRDGRTALLKLAERCGCRTVGPNAMVEGQAAAILDFMWHAD